MFPLFIAILKFGTTQILYNRAFFLQDLREINLDDTLGPFANDPCRMAQTFQETFDTSEFACTPKG